MFINLTVNSKTNFKENFIGKKLYINWLVVNDLLNYITEPSTNTDEILTDQPPVIANQVDDILFTDFPANKVVDLSNTFDDPDNDNADIIITLEENYNTIDFEAIIENKELTVERLTMREAETTLIIRATSNGKTVDMTVNVNSEKVDQPPVIVNQVDDIIITDYPASETIDLYDVFNDPDDENENIIISLESNSNENDFSANIENKILTVTRLTELEAEAILVVRAVSNDKFVDMNINVGTQAIDQPPVIANQIDDITITNFPADTVIYLYDAFDDPDNDNNEIVITLESNSNTTDFNIEIENKELYISRLENIEAQAELVIRATSNGKYIDMTVNVNSYIYDAYPVIANQVDDILFTNFPADTTVDLQYTFDDPDNNNDNIIISLIYNSDATDFNAEIANKELTITRLTNNQANGELIIRATSNGKTVDMTVYVNSLDADLPPVIANQVDDILFTNFPADTTVDLQNTFNDPDNNNDDIIITMESNSNTTDFNAEITNKELTITRLTNNQADGELIIRATSNGKTVDMTVYVNSNYVFTNNVVKEKIMLYPNPASTFIFIKNYETKNVNYFIYNDLGQIIKKGITNNSMINVNDLTNGIYFIKFENLDKNFKFVKK